MFAAFEEVARLYPREAAALLRDGDAQERVWASWVIARAYGEAAAAGLRVALEGVADALRVDAPEVVVRAVAGLLFDPDENVRWAMRRRVDRGDFPREPFDAALAVLQHLERTRPRVASRPDQVALEPYRPPLRLV